MLEVSKISRKILKKTANRITRMDQSVWQLWIFPHVQLLVHSHSSCREWRRTRNRTGAGSGWTDRTMGKLDIWSYLLKFLKIFCLDWTLSFGWFGNFEPTYWHNVPLREMSPPFQRLFLPRNKTTMGISMRRFPARSMQIALELPTEWLKWAFYDLLLKVFLMYRIPHRNIL